MNNILKWWFSSFEWLLMTSSLDPLCPRGHQPKCGDLSIDLKPWCKDGKFTKSMMNPNHVGYSNCRLYQLRGYGPFTADRVFFPCLFEARKRTASRVSSKPHRHEFFFNFSTKVFSHRRINTSAVSVPSASWNVSMCSWCLLIEFFTPQNSSCTTQETTTHRAVDSGSWNLKNCSSPLWFSSPGNGSLPNKQLPVMKISHKSLGQYVNPSQIWQFETCSTNPHVFAVYSPNWIIGPHT